LSAPLYKRRASDFQTDAMVLSGDEVAAVSPRGSVEPEKKKGCRKKSRKEDGRGKPEPKKRAPRAKKPVPVLRKTAFQLFPENRPLIDMEQKEEVLEEEIRKVKEAALGVINEFMDEFKEKKRVNEGFPTLGEVAELRYLNQLMENPNAKPEKRSTKRDGRTAWTPSNPNYNPRVMTHLQEEEYDKPVIEQPVMAKCTDRFGVEHAFDSKGYHRRDQLVYTPEYIKSIPGVSPAALQHYEMLALHERAVEPVLNKLGEDEFKANEEVQTALKHLAAYKAGTTTTHLKDWASILLECAERLQESSLSESEAEDSDDADTVDWSVSSESDEVSELDALIDEIKEFIQSLDG